MLFSIYYNILYMIFNIFRDFYSEFLVDLQFLRSFMSIMQDVRSFMSIYGLYEELCQKIMT